MGVIYNLKILPEYFIPVAEKIKTFEVRKNDRDYHVGDVLVLREWNGEYTGRAVQRKIVYIFYGNGEYGIAEGYCVLGLSADMNDRYNPR